MCFRTCLGWPFSEQTSQSSPFCVCLQLMLYEIMLSESEVRSKKARKTNSSSCHGGRSIFCGMKLCHNSNKVNESIVPFDSVIVGYVDPTSPSRWEYDIECIITNHPKWGGKWPHEVTVSKDEENAVIPIPPDWDRLEELADEIRSLSSKDGDEYDNAADRLNDIHMDMDSLRCSIPRFEDPEVGWYIIMDTNSDVEDNCRFQPTIISEVLYHMFNTIKHLNSSGRSKEIKSFGIEEFRSIHEEIAIGANQTEDIEYSSFEQLLKQCTKGISTKDIKGCITPDVINEYGSFDSAMSSALRRHIKEKAEESKKKNDPCNDKTWTVVGK